MPLSVSRPPRRIHPVVRRLIAYVDAQAGQHIATDATENGVTIHPAAILISNVEALIGEISGSDPPV